MTTQIEDMKKTGIFEEIILLPMGNYAAICGANLYQVCMSIVKILIYFIFGSLLAGNYLVEPEYFLAFILTLALVLSSFIFISLIASSMSIWFARSAIVPITYITLSLVLGEIYFPKELLYADLSFLSNIFSLSPSLENFRMLTSSEFDKDIFGQNVIHLFVLNFLYGTISLYMLKRSIIFAKTNGSFLYY